MSDDPAPLPQPPVKTGCIYAVRNTLNGKEYIGQTRQHPPEKRWSQHRRGDDTYSMILHRAIHKYGVDVFKFEILESGIPYENIAERERFWVAERNTIVPNGYNSTSGGEKGYIFSEEARRKMSNSHRGIPLSPAHREAKRLACQNSPYNKLHSKPVTATNSVTGEVIVFPSRHACAKYFGTGANNVSGNMLRGMQTFRKIWKLYDGAITP